ncbi:MAG: tyrosine-type recombinase/integrase [Acidimicrobiales bacterium]
MSAARGTMRQRSPGSWQLRVYAGLDSAGKPVQVAKTFRGTKREAQVELARLAVQVESGQGAVASNATVAELLDRWVEHVSPTRQPGTIRGYQTHAKRIKEQVGKVKLLKLTAQQLDRAYRVWLDEGLSPTTVHHLHAILAAALHQAERWGLIGRSPTDLATPPRSRWQPSVSATPADVQALVAAAEEVSPVLATAIVLAALTGARRGELCGLRWSDIEDGVLHVRRAVKHGVDKRELVVGPTKTHQERAVSLDTSAQRFLAAWRVRVQAWAAGIGTEVLPDGYVLPGGPGWLTDPSGAEPMKPDTLSSAFERLAHKTSVRLRFHDLRHFNASQLIGAGVDVRTVAGRLGHADASTTLRVYAHTLAERDRKAAEIIGRLVVPLDDATN